MNAVIKNLWDKETLKEMEDLTYSCFLFSLFPLFYSPYPVFSFYWDLTKLNDNPYYLS